MYASPKEATVFYGVSRETIRLWANKDKIKYKKTIGGHRKYWIPNKNNEGKIKVNFKKKTPDTILYSRVSSKKQDADLSRQKESIKNFAKKEKFRFLEIQDIGSGVNFKRKGLQTLLEHVMQGNIKRIVVAHKDRLARIGFNLIEWILDKYGTSIQVSNREINSDYKEDIKEDLIAILTHYTAKYYGSRKYKSKLKNSYFPKSEK